VSDLRYRVEWRRTVEVTAKELIEAFDAEWVDAQKRGLNEDAFARECLAECDFDTLADVGREQDDNWEVDTP